MNQTTKTRVTKSSVSVRGKKYVRYVVSWRDTTGERKRKTFSKLADARRDAEQRDKDEEKRKQVDRIIRNKIGDDASRLSPATLRDAVDALTILKGHATLKDAAAYFMKYAKPDGGTLTLAAGHERFIAKCKAEGLRPATIKSYDDQIKRLCRDLGKGKMLHEITLGVFEGWLGKAAKSQGTRKSYIRHLGAFFQYAVDRKHMVENPARKLRAKMDAKPVTYLSAKDAAKLLTTASIHDPELVPYIALGLFAGLRPSEIHGERTGHAPLDWRCIHIADSEPYIDITPEQDKNREGRHVDMTANLLKWLAPHKQDAGPIVYTRNRFETIVTKSGVTYGKDIMRHSFGTWHWAMHRHEGETAIQLGDTIKTVKKHYVNPRVKQSDAVKYWAVEPVTESNVIEMSKAG